MLKKSHPLLKKKEKARAFTLVEIMYVVAIIGVIGLILTSLMVDSTRSMLWSIDKSLITKDFRTFTMRITQDAYNSSFAYLYPSFNISDCDAFNDRRGGGLSGDCLVLVQTEPSPNTDSQRFFRRIIVYYRQPDANGEGTVFRREIVFNNPTNSTENAGNDPNFFETFLNNQRNTLNLPETVLRSTRGLADSSQLFYHFRNGTFLINGEIINGVNAPTVTNTYNLTISTRG